MSRPTFMMIDLAALQHNFDCVRRLTHDRSVIAMVKANAYGHGIERVAKSLSKANAFGVASLEEGLLLREAGVKQPIVLMEGLFFADELPLASQYQLSVVVHHLPQLEYLEKANILNPISVWLKINTGMHRLGFCVEKVADVYQRLSALACVNKPIGLMTHFAKADDGSSDATTRQMALFHQTTQHLSGPRSLANSAGIIQWEESHADWVRPGLMLYGASPMVNKVGKEHGLKPVMTLSSRIIAITEVKKDEAVGYGGTWRAPYDTKVGIVGVGYGDGYPQFAKNGTPVLVNGKRSELVGRVSMDMLAVNLSNLPEAQIGDTVILWGDGLPVEDVALHNSTSAYEVLTRMTPRPKVEVRGV